MIDGKALDDCVNWLEGSHIQSYCSKSTSRGGFGNTDQYITPKKLPRLYHDLTEGSDNKNG